MIPRASSLERKSPLEGNPLAECATVQEIEQYYYRSPYASLAPRNTVSYVQAIVTK